MVTLRDCLDIIKDRHSILSIDDINGAPFVLCSSISTFLQNVKENEMFTPSAIDTLISGRYYTRNDKQMKDIETYEELYDRVLKLNGEQYQITVAIEELSELQKELTKYLRGKGDINHIAEETADCEIVIEQIKRLFDLERHVQIEKLLKLSRLKSRVLEKECKETA